jgi:8-oxo-dGTP diphosphatase
MVDDELIETVALVHIRARRLLLVRPAGKAAYYMPGGKREPGESERAALVREIREELGSTIAARSLRACGVFEDQAYGRPNGAQVRISCYFGELPDDAAPTGEIDEFGYFSSGEYAQLGETAPAVHQIMADLQQRGLLA